MVKKRASSQPKSQKKIRRLSPWLLLAAGAIVVFLLRGLVASFPTEAADTPYVDIWLRVWLIFVLGFGIACAYFLHDSEFRSDLFAILIGIWLAGMLLLVLKNTHYSLNGIHGDAGFQTAQVTKFAAYSSSVDFAYKDLSAFYPPLYYFILGKSAAFLQIAPYKLMKYGLIVIAFLLPFLTRRAWSLIVPGLGSPILALSVLFVQDFYKPAEWLALFLFVPWWIYFVEGIGNNARQRKWQWFLAGSFLGALIFTSFYYWFFIGGVSLIASLFLKKLDPAGKLGSTSSWADKLKILGGTALFSLPYWGPYLVSMWATGGWSPLQNRYFVPDFANLEMPFLQISITGLFLLVGLVYLLISYKKSQLSFALLALLLGAYIWQMAGYVTLLLNTPLLTFKARDFVIYVLVIAALLACYDLSVRILTRKDGPSRWASLITGMTFLLALYFGQKVGQDLITSDLLSTAKTEIYPQALIADYERASMSDNFDRVILGDNGVAELSIYLPVYQFVPWAAHFSHPAGLYYERIAFLTKLGEVEEPAWFAAAVMNNRFSQIDELILFQEDNGYRFAYRPENFPYSVDTQTIFFQETLLPGEFFSSKPIGDFVLFSPVFDNDPLKNLPAIEGVTSISTFGDIGDANDMYMFLRDFGPYLQFENQDRYQEILDELFAANLE